VCDDPEREPLAVVVINTHQLVLRELALKVLARRDVDDRHGEEGSGGRERRV
jgi:hypothetical protein